MWRWIVGLLCWTTLQMQDQRDRAGGQKCWALMCGNTNPVDNKPVLFCLTRLTWNIMIKSWIRWLSERKNYIILITVTTFVYEIWVQHQWQCVKTPHPLTLKNARVEDIHFCLCVSINIFKTNLAQFFVITFLLQLS